MFVFFYSATCPACRRFDPIWEETSCAYDGKKVVFAHLEGNENQGVINAYQVTHTPTLALFHRVSFKISFHLGHVHPDQVQRSSIQRIPSVLRQSTLLPPLSSQQQSEDPNPGSPAAHITDLLEALRVSFAFFSLSLVLLLARHRR